MPQDRLQPVGRHPPRVGQIDLVVPALELEALLGRDLFHHANSLCFVRVRADVQRLVEAENADRRRLYQEIARANGFPEKAGEVQAIFADSWRDKAAKGWYLEQEGGGWKQR